MIPVEQLKESSFYKYILEEGLQKGRAEGRQEGGAALLRHQLEHRFGPLPKWAASMIEEADSLKLEEWGTRLLDAGSLEEVIGDDDSE
jgi:predicted transposase YdaD